MQIFKRKRPLDYLLYSLIIVGAIIIDALTKILAVNFLKPIGSVPIIEGVIHLTYVENEGAAFGILSNHRWVFIAVSAITIIAFTLYLYLGHAENRLYAVSLSLISAGGIGNMIDRVALGYVVDFIDFALIDFAVFNVADSFVCIGAGILILALILDLKKEAAKKK